MSAEREQSKTTDLDRLADCVRERNEAWERVADMEWQLSEVLKQCDGDIEVAKEMAVEPGLKRIVELEAALREIANLYEITCAPHQAIAREALRPKVKP